MVSTSVALICREAADAESTSQGATDWRVRQYDCEALSIKNDMIGPLEYNGKPSNDGLEWFRSFGIGAILDPIFRQTLI